MGINVKMTMAKFCNGILTRVSIVFAHNIFQSPLTLSFIKNKYYIFPRDRCIYVTQVPVTTPNAAIDTLHWLSREISKSHVLQVNHPVLSRFHCSYLFMRVQRLSNWFCIFFNIKINSCILGRMFRQLLTAQLRN